MLFHPSVDVASIDRLTTTAGITKVIKNITQLYHFLSPFLTCLSTPPPSILSSLLSPFFLSSGFPFFTVAKTRSPAPAPGSHARFSRPLVSYSFDSNDVEILGSSAVSKVHHRTHW